MPSLRRAAPAALLVLLIACAVLSHAQAANSIDEQFAARHARLTGLADQLVSDGGPLTDGGPLKPSVGLSGDSEAIAPSPTGQPAVPNSALARIRQLRPLMEPILVEEGVPATLAAVALVESGGRLDALSDKGALGLWQLMPQTARRFGLTVSAATDERLDAVKSTRAAARYLRELRLHFGDWQLAFAAYNAGEQRVEQALRRAGSADFLRLGAHLPAETRSYVPAVRSAVSLLERTPPATLEPGSARPVPVVFALAGSAD